jgi:Phage capsid family
MTVKTTPTSPAAWRPDITAYVPSDVIPDALILQCANVVGRIEGDEPAVRVPFVADDGTVGFVAEGAEIPDANQAFSEIVVTTDKVAALGKYSYETLQQPEAARLVVESLSRAVTQKANAAFLANAGAPTGLLNDLGILDGGTITTDLDPLIDAVSDIESTNGTATHVIAAPDAWAFLSKSRAKQVQHKACSAQAHNPLNAPCSACPSSCPTPCPPGTCWWWTRARSSRRRVQSGWPARRMRTSAAM